MREESATSVMRIYSWCQQVTPKRRRQSTKLQGVTFQKTEILEISSARISYRTQFGSFPGL
jgi:hypothetical protein